MIRNKSNIFWLIEVSTEKRMENVCNNALRTLMQFPFLFWLIPGSTEKILDSFLNSLSVEFIKFFISANIAKITIILTELS